MVSFHTLAGSKSTPSFLHAELIRALDAGFSALPLLYPGLYCQVNMDSFRITRLFVSGLEILLYNVGVGDNDIITMY